MEESRTHFRLCSSCKGALAFGATYYACSVSTCNRKRTGLTFCSVACFEAHVPMVRHREAWAEEQRAPSRDAWLAEQAEEQNAEVVREQARDRRRVVGVGAPTPASTTVEMSEDVPREILLVVSKLKAYIRARSGFNTSDTMLEPLSDIVRQLADDAIERAAAEGRRTVMDRDL